MPSKPTNQPKTEPNAGLELAQFDYTNLTGTAFEDYQKIERSLLFGQKYDFEVWLATSIMKFRINENSGEKEQYMNGITLNGAKPIEVTRISALQAMELNRQITHLNGAEYRGTSKYLLLKKPVNQPVEV